METGYTGLSLSLSMVRVKPERLALRSLGREELTLDAWQGKERSTASHRVEFSGFRGNSMQLQLYGHKTKPKSTKPDQTESKPSCVADTLYVNVSWVPLNTTRINK